MKMWSTYEDSRLLAGIYRYGVNNWAPISRFVGNSRTRAQCAQRWGRGLNPRICKSSWDPSEDLRLVQLVQTYGDKAWTKVSGSMGNRSDVQCRYHYHQLAKDMPQLLQMASRGAFAFPGMEFTRPIPVKPVFQGMPHGRFSMPNRPPIESEPEEKVVAVAQRRRASQCALGLRREEGAPLPVNKIELHSEDEAREGTVGTVALPEVISIENLLNHH
jgi:hypothetical protein